MKFKVGDIVMVKNPLYSIPDSMYANDDMKKLAGKKVKIIKVESYPRPINYVYRIEEDHSHYVWVDDFFEEFDQMDILLEDLC